MSFAPFYGTIRLILNLLNPFMSNGMLVRSKSCSRPGFVKMHNIQFNIHNTPTMTLLDCLVIKLRFKVGGDIKKKRIVGRGKVRIRKVMLQRI